MNNVLPYRKEVESRFIWVIVMSDLFNMDGGDYITILEYVQAKTMLPFSTL